MLMVLARATSVSLSSVHHRRWFSEIAAVRTSWDAGAPVAAASHRAVSTRTRSSRLEVLEPGAGRQAEGRAPRTDMGQPPADEMTERHAGSEATQPGPGLIDPRLSVEGRVREPAPNRLVDHSGSLRATPETLRPNPKALDPPRSADGSAPESAVHHHGEPDVCSDEPLMQKGASGAGQPPGNSLRPPMADHATTPFGGDSPSFTESVSRAAEGRRSEPLTPASPNRTTQPTMKQGHGRTAGALHAKVQSQLVRIRTRASAADSAPHTSPGRPRIWRTLLG